MTCIPILCRVSTIIVNGNSLHGQKVCRLAAKIQTLLLKIRSAPAAALRLWG